MCGLPIFLRSILRLFLAPVLVSLSVQDPLSVSLSVPDSLSVSLSVPDPLSVALSAPELTLT